MDCTAALERGKDANKNGKYSQSVKELTAVLEHLEAHPESTTQLLDALLELAEAERYLAQHERAEEHLKKASELCATENDESLECSKVLHGLGRLRLDQYKLEEAQSLLNQVFEIRKKVCSNPSAELAEAMNSLGLVALRTGEDAKSPQWFEKALDIRLKALGEDNGDYAETLDSRALLLGKTGKLETAEEGHRKALAIKGKCLCQGHPELGYSLLNLAHALKQQHKLAEVEDLEKRAIDIFTNSYGQDSPVTAVAVNNLGGYYQERGNLIEALACYQKALASKERTLGKDNPGLVRNLHNVAVILRLLNRKEEAQEYSRRAEELVGQKIVRGEEKNIDTLIQVADKYLAEKNFEEGQKVLSKALELACSEFGPESLRAAKVFTSLL